MDRASLDDDSGRIKDYGAAAADELYFCFSGKGDGFCRFRRCAGYRCAAGAADGLSFVVLYQDVPVFFALQIDFFTAFCVVEAQFMKPVAFVCFCFEAALGDAFLQIVDGHVVGVVDTAGDDGTIRVAVNKINEDLISDTGYELATSA